LKDDEMKKKNNKRKIITIKRIRIKVNIKINFKG